MHDEWLLTNGIGGFAMGCPASADGGVNRRRYHGLLIAAAAPPVGRIVALHSIIDQLLVNDQVLELATQSFGAGSPLEPPIIHPDGWRHQTGNRIALPHRATWTYQCSGVTLARTLELHQGVNAAEIAWEIVAGNAAATLRARPLTPLRDFHGLGHEGADEPSGRLVDDQTLLVHHGELELRLSLTHGRWRLEPQWWRNFHYTHDAARGQRCREDVWSPGLFEAEIGAGHRVVLQAELTRPHHKPPTIPRFQWASPAVDDSAGRLRIAADQFIVQRRMADASGGWSSSIIAGYPWFSDWGRDTMISLPGLMLCTGRTDEAKATLLTFARNLRGGLIPNRFDDYAGAAHYNTVDASLWFVHAVHAVHALLRHQRDEPLDAQLLNACRAVVHAYRHGTDYDIAMDSDGLIAAGSAQTQLTWMDAKRDGVTFTPRHGKAIEINALWHHALHCLAAMTSDRDEAASLRAQADITADAIGKQFWNDRAGCCYDVLTFDGDSWVPDEAIRPNQVLAVSLDPSPLSPQQQADVMQVVQRELLTPYGLRTLAPGHPSYRGRFEGGLMQRDGAYHQGTVWPWLIGPYCDAVLRVGNDSQAAKAQVRRAIEPLLRELDRGCFGQIAEVYDGDAPHRASGCPAQAWSVAELLRVQSR